MAINVSQAFHRTSANPVDESMALTKAQMLTVNDNLMPAYYLTICQDDGFIYLYDKTATPSGTTGKFKKFEGGGGAQLPAGGTTGQVLAKKSNADNDVEWKNDEGGQTIQYTTLPTASATELNKVYQYVGTTTGSYTYGYFYKCVSTGGGYAWQQLDVQPSSGGSGGDSISKTLVASSWNSSNQQTLTFTGVTANTNGTLGVPITVTAAQKAAYEAAGITVVSISSNQITFEAKDVPSVDLPVVLITV